MSRRAVYAAEAEKLKRSTNEALFADTPARLTPSTKRRSYPYASIAEKNRIVVLEKRLDKAFAAVDVLLGKIAALGWDLRHALSPEARGRNSRDS